MKNLIKRAYTSPFVRWCAIIAPLALAGCTTSHPVVTTQPVVTAVPTPIVTTTVNPTNGVITTATNIVEVYHTNQVTTTNIVYAPDSSALSNASAAVQGVIGSVAPFAPVYAAPASAVSGWLFALFGAASTAYASYKNAKAQGVAKAVIAGIESAPPPGGNDSTPITVTRVKQSVQNQAALMGITQAVHSAVQAIT